MIEEKKIQDEARDRYASYCGKPNPLLEVEGPAFTEGAHWALQEFRKSLWHDVKKELPEDNKRCLVRGLFEGGGFNREAKWVRTHYVEYFVSFYQSGKPDWDSWSYENIPIESCEDHSSNELEDITHWCYLEEIIEKLEDLK